MTDRAVRLAIVLAGMAVGGTLVAIALKLSYQFTGQGDPDEVASDALIKGTAISPPLTLLVLVVVAILLVRSDRGVSRKVGLIGLALIGLVVTIGSLGELPGVDAFEGAERVLVVVWDVVGAIVAAALAFFSVRAFAELSRPPAASG